MADRSLGGRSGNAIGSRFAIAAMPAAGSRRNERDRAAERGDRNDPSSMAGVEAAHQKWNVSIADPTTCPVKSEPKFSCAEFHTARDEKTAEKGIFQNSSLRSSNLCRAYAPKPWKIWWVASVLKVGSRAQRLRLLRMEPFTALVLSTLVEISRSSVRLCAAALSRTWQWSS